MSSLALPIPPIRLIVACGTALVVGGCQESKPAKQKQPKIKPDTSWSVQPLGGVAALGASPVAVKDGPPPLFYLSEVPQTLRVIDLTTKQTLAEIDATALTILKVDAATGVAAGPLMLYPGPLSADHRYAIYVIPSGENMTRTGRFQPRPANRAPSAGQSSGQ